MKRKIILSLLALFVISAIGMTITALYIRTTTTTLGRLIKLHQIEDLRKNLIMSVQTVQSDLYTFQTRMGQKLDNITDNMLNLEQAAGKCSTCHHEPEVEQQLGELQSHLKEYQVALSAYITASANPNLIAKLKFDAATIGGRILASTEQMSILGRGKLEQVTAAAMNRIRKAWIVLSATAGMTLVIGIFIAVHLIRSVTRPITTLVDATRRIARGSLDFHVPVVDRNEFGQLAENFNVMTHALRDGNAKVEQEIAERAQTEAALKKSESFLNTIFDSIHDPFCIIDRDYRIVRANEAYAELKQTGLPELVGKRCFEVLYGKSAPCDGCLVEKTFLSGDSCAKDKLVTVDGHRMWLEIYTYAIPDHDGGISHVVEYTRDITGRKKAEEALRYSEERYALAARGANDGLWDWDLTSNTIYFSHRWKAMLGYGDPEISNNPEEWIGRVHPDDRPALEAMITAHVAGGDPHFEGEFRILHKDGGYRWVLNRGLAVRNKSGKAHRMAGSQTDITARKKAEEQLVYDAFHDVLTGLPNRALFMDRLQHVIAGSRRPGHLYAVLFLDVDRFKIINDSLGHLAGDDLLISIGKRLVKCVRPGDTVARLGGDEFAVLLERILHLSDAVDIAERMRSAMTAPLHIQGNEIFVSASVGIALGIPAYERPEQVLRDADIAMYQAKGRGSGGYEIYDSSMHANIVSRLKLEADLRRAVDRGEFVLHYQPIMDLTANRLIGFEALVRWEHPHHGMIYPLDFIPLAEETGLIVPIGEWVLSEACRQLSRWQKSYPLNPALKMSMNIASKQFIRSDLAEIVARMLRETGVSPESLALEVTESMIMENMESATATMQALRAMGVHIHIDDFGTGYSSLSYLHNFPVSALKIDKTFITKMAESGENQEIILSIVALAKSLNLAVIAEGIELNHQLSSIRDMQCQYGQGFIFSRPMDPAAVESWIKCSTHSAG